LHFLLKKLVILQTAVVAVILLWFLRLQWWQADSGKKRSSGQNLLAFHLSFSLLHAVPTHVLSMMYLNHLSPELMKLSSQLTVLFLLSPALDNDELSKPPFGTEL
jgi:hypothetical protein